MFNGNGSGHGSREQDYRANTDRNAARMNGVTTQMTFVCWVCKQPKAKAGRVEMVPKAKQFGHRCAVCVAKRGAA